MIEPFLKWPGGKRWLIRRYSGLFPKKYKRYFEPFLGGGAVFFSLLPRQGHLSDSNAELVNVYKCLKTSHAKIERGLARYHKRHSSRFYYTVREDHPTDPIKRAIRFLYLNRTCFNGIYRVNLNGVFNVPIGTKTTVSFEQGYLETVAASLRTATIKARDFEKAINEAERDDFVYVDPPYTVMHNNNGFVKYNAKLFSWPDQARLAKALKSAHARGAFIMLSNADHPSVRTLYDGFGSRQTLSRPSVLSGDSSFRRSATELLITNY
jgi:DNA adenine methylase